MDEDRDKKGASCGDDGSMASEVHLVRVTTDDGEWRIWLAATDRDHAVDSVLDAIPEGWTASLMKNKLSAVDIANLHMQPGEVREIPNDA
ncbi:hypothetical protein JQ615_30955 [Bradyrhizobium jicamae]|uniref:DUF1902 domain-containing protein n=1 Tax=Bradyrhizobium jicamae TaxID=280332 RepID=A0ABS5FSN1_9BRAD|nr:hypothetical protein [Bradyrhizobium jicamae]MBR0799800.1 hypothetical protein [Bradyrhizobium jicamae]